MKIQFINPPFLGRFSRAQRSPGVIKSGTMYYPYWLAFAAAVAEKQGHNINLVDCPASGRTESDLIDDIFQFSPDLIVMESVTSSWQSDIALSEVIKRQFPNIKICLVGTHVTAMWKETLESQPAVDFVAIGEYDYTISELADCLQYSRPSFEKVAGLAYKSHRQIRRNNDRPLIQDMDDLPWISPIYKKFLNPTDYYFNLSYHPMVMLIGGRGCTAMCFYCVYPQVMHGHRYRHRSPENIIREILWIQQNMPEIKEITFEDDNFAADRKFAREFARLAKENSIKLPFFANLRTTVDFETLKSLREAGLRNTAVGFESGDNRILKNMRKGQDTVRQIEFVENAHKLGLLVHGCFMVGFPGETRETMRKTLDLAFKVKPDSAQFYPVMPYPGTGAYSYYSKQGYMATGNFRDWLTVEGGHRCVLNLPGLTAENIEKFCEKAFRAFHFRPRYLLYKLLQAIKNPREGWRSLNAGLKYLFYLFTNRRKKQQPFAVQAPPMCDEWLGHIPVPMGRMEKRQKAKGDHNSG
ncbi:radical SAM protein [candidate division KSB1 bacterium]|nr:radical SAM protein [candidate division KSB1 bacterium]